MGGLITEDEFDQDAKVDQNTGHLLPTTELVRLFDTPMFDKGVEDNLDQQLEEAELDPRDGTFEEFADFLKVNEPTQEEIDEHWATRVAEAQAEEEVAPMDEDTPAPVEPLMPDSTSATSSSS